MSERDGSRPRRRKQFGWIDLDVFDDHGWPRELGGVVDQAPGLYFMGLGFQSSARSMLIHGAGYDAAHVAGQIVKRRVDRQLAERRQPTAA